MKTSELTGAQLDYWVAKARYGDGAHIAHGAIKVPEEYTGWSEGAPFSPSVDWAQCGPIIECEPFGIFEKLECEWFAGIYQPRHGFKDECIAYQSGSTMLIAAMRAYVASKFGEEVTDTTG